jgi:hypothetical protein
LTVEFKKGDVGHYKVSDIDSVTASPKKYNIPLKKAPITKPVVEAVEEISGVEYEDESGNRHSGDEEMKCHDCGKTYKYRDGGETNKGQNLCKTCYSDYRKEQS